jgi:hypothetical protein
MQNSFYTADYKNRERQSTVRSLQIFSLTGRMLVAITEGPVRFQDEFNEIVREMSLGDEELYGRIQSEFVDQVEQFKIDSQKLVNGEQLDIPTDPESRKILHHLIKMMIRLIRWTFSLLFSNSIMLTLRILVFTINFIKFII